MRTLALLFFSLTSFAQNYTPGASFTRLSWLGNHKALAGRNLIGLYDFITNGTGTFVLKDISPVNGNDFCLGSATNPCATNAVIPLWVAAGQTFNGATQYDQSTSTVFQNIGTSDMTYQVVELSSGAAERYIVDNTAARTLSGFGLDYRGASTPKAARCYWRNGAGSNDLLDSTVTIGDGAYHSVTCRRSSTFADVFVDGVKAGTPLAAHSYDVTSARSLYFGSSSVPSAYFSGTVAYGTIYTRSLTDSRIAWNYVVLKGILAIRGLSLP